LIVFGRKLQLTIVNSPLSLTIFPHSGYLRHRDFSPTIHRLAIITATEREDSFEYFAGATRGTAMMKGPLTRLFPQLTKEQRARNKEQRAQNDVVLKAVNRDFSNVVVAVRREFGGIENWKQLSKSKASVVSRIAAAIQSVDTAPDDLLNNATRTVIQEIYAIEEWPTTKRVVVSRAAAAIRRLKQGGRMATR
jgi:hypothetical protein